jgi:Tfp pilus assembly protein PilO
MLEAYRDDFWYSLRHPRVRAGMLVSAVAVLVMLMVGIAYWWPAWNAAVTLKTQIEQKRRQAVEASYSTQLAQISRRAAQHVAQIEKKLDASGTQVTLVQNLATLARRHNVKILSEAYEEGKAKDGYVPFVHELTLQGGYAELRQFLVALQELPTFTIVQDAVMSRAGNAAVIKAQLHMHTYRKVESRSSGAK